MRDQKRIAKALKLLKELWLKNPDSRLGQLLENYVFVNGQRGDQTSIKLFYQEDDETIKNLEKALKNEKPKENL